MTSLIETLEMLKTLRDKELITGDEYDSRRSQVLDGLAPAPATAQFTLRGISGPGLSIRVEAPELSIPSDRDPSRLGDPFEDTTLPPEVKDRTEDKQSPRVVAVWTVAGLAEDGHQPCGHTYDPFAQLDGSCPLCMALRELQTA